jgi:hypothetical protein
VVCAAGESSPPLDVQLCSLPNGGVGNCKIHDANSSNGGSAGHCGGGPQDVWRTLARFLGDQIFAAQVKPRTGFAFQIENIDIDPMSIRIRQPGSTAALI